MSITVTKRCRFYDGSRLVDSYSETETGLVAGGFWTPSHPSHMPAYDDEQYYYYEIIYDGEHYEDGSSIVCPDTDFTVRYNFYGDPTRPDNWSWWSTVQYGAPMPYTKISDTEIEARPLKAAEWNEFIDLIFYFLEYKGATISSGSISDFYVTKGDVMTAEKADYARQLIGVMNPPKALPSAITAGKRITAAYINGLKNSLNSIK